MSITLAPITVRAYRPVALPNGNAVIVDPRESSVLLETYSPQNPDTTLMSEALNYEQYAQMRAENPDIAFPELVKPVPADQQGQDSTQAQQGRIQPNTCTPDQPRL